MRLLRLALSLALLAAPCAAQSSAFVPLGNFFDPSGRKLFSGTLLSWQIVDDKNQPVFPTGAPRDFLTAVKISKGTGNLFLPFVPQSVFQQSDLRLNLLTSTGATLTSLLSYTPYSAGGASVNALAGVFAIDANQRVCIGDNATGVGGFVPSLQLGRASSNGNVDLTLRRDTGGFGWNIGVVDPSTSAQLRIASIDPAGTFTDRMIINDNGNIGIGTTETARAKLTVSGVGGTAFQTGPHAFLQQPAPITGSNAGGGTIDDVSISASNGIHAQFYRAFSDARIKSIIGRSDAAEDLNTLTGIEITDYIYKDALTKGDRTQKKVIAQQVESVFPQAVSLSTNVVPDIYQRATHASGWIHLATNLQVGERVRLIAEKAEGIHEVLEIRDGAFRTGFVPAGEMVFVYGREVQDFRSVDYEAISMLNVSATQQLARQVATLEIENAALRSRLASLEAMAVEVATLKAAVQPLLAK